MGRHKASPPIQGLMLRTRPPGHDLDQYIFLNEAHAREWLSQAFVTDDAYSLAQCTYRERRCCGERYAIRQHTLMRVSDWLAQQRRLIEGG